MRRAGPVPTIRTDLDHAAEVFPTVRQSILAKFDDCELTALFTLRYEGRWSTHPQARGQIFHRFAAECLREMQRMDSETIPVGAALGILEETLRQRNVAPEDRVRLPRRELPALRMACRKFAKDNAFTIRNVIDVERRLTAPLRYPRDPNAIGADLSQDGPEVRTRHLTGQLDALIARGEDEAIVLDWKDTWALPPKRDEDAEDPGVSYHGYFQQRFYAWLVMMNYPAIQAVTLREFYARRTQVRSARLTRDKLPTVEAELRDLLQDFDEAVAAGQPGDLRLETLERHGYWKPSPGAHCFNCRKAQVCPIDDDYKDQGVRTPEQASKAAAVRQQMRAVLKHIDQALMPWADLHGPIPLKSAKGRRVLGYRHIAGGKKTRFEEYTPEGADRPPTQASQAAEPVDDLVDALDESLRRARGEEA